MRIGTLLWAVLAPATLLAQQLPSWNDTAPKAAITAFVERVTKEGSAAYDRESHVGRLVRGLDEGPKRGWTIVSMKDDWKTVFAPH